MRFFELFMVALVVTLLVKGAPVMLVAVIIGCIAFMEALAMMRRR